MKPEIIIAVVLGLLLANVSYTVGRMHGKREATADLELRGFRDAGGSIEGVYRCTPDPVYIKAGALP